MKDFSQLKKNLKKDFTALKPVKIAVLGDSATQFLTQALRGTGYDAGLDLQIFEADFNQIGRQVLDPNSDLYAFQPTIVILFQATHKLLGKFNKLEAPQQVQMANAELEQAATLYQTLQSQRNAKVLYYNYTEIDDAVFGNFANKTENSFLFQLRKLNYLLMDFATKNSNFHLVDLSSIQNQIGKATFFQPSIYINSEMVLSLDALPLVASKTVALMTTLEGKFKKCVILDLDNTTWGGIIGDDGLEHIQIGSLGIGKAFTEFQYWIKKLKNRGVIVAVCSKNTESIAKEPFEKHPDMVLRLEDISVFKANWDNKVSNIQEIQSLLNIGFDSMVFLDDNPFERAIVRENIPEITVPELPEDPADYLEYLYGLNLFETVSFSEEDLVRTQLYQTEALRKSTFEKFTSEEEFLKSLNMISVISKFDSFNIPRVAQLSQRSNQFNLRTIRYSESEIEKLAQSEDYFTFAFTLEDQFGDNGWIAVVILKKQDSKTLFIDTWFMSCRVLKRGMEAFVLNFIMGIAKENGFQTVVGEYLPTLKNELVQNHYENLGFTKEAELWLRDVATFEATPTYISQHFKN